MNGERITDVTYLQGHSSLGVQRIKMTLWATTTSLSFVKKDNQQPLFSIPWTNLRKLQDGHVLREGWRNLAYFLDFTHTLGPTEIGFWIVFWDESVQRDQKVFVVTGDHSRSDKIINALWAYRDDFVRYMETQSHPIKSGH
jgi:hypothetical protein